MVALLFDIRAGRLHVTPDQPAQVVLRDVDDAILDDSGTRNRAAAHLLSPSPEFGPAHQQLIDRQLAKSGVRCHDGGVANLLDTQIALVEADEGIAIIPSFGVPACRNRKVVMSRLIDPVVTLDFHQISRRGRAMPPAADDFATFLKAYIARWAGRAGVL
jgi:DNA-binding transcriptional LysR family regulator